MNKFDRAVIYLLASLTFGGLGGYLTICRILTILYVPLLLKNYNSTKNILRPIVKCIALFYSYCIISMIWTPDVVQGFKELIYYPIHFLFFVEIIVFSSKAINPLKSIALGWLITTISTICIGVYELMTDVHFGIGQESDRQMNFGGGMLLSQRFARAFYANYNTLVTALCFALPFILYSLFKYKNEFKIRLATILAFILSFVIIVTNASRGGILTIMSMSAIVFMFSKPSIKKTITIILFVGIIGFIFIKYYDLLFSILELRMSSGDASKDNTRLMLWSIAIQICINTFGFGSGIGSIVVKFEDLNPGGISITHNMFLEFLCQYGIIFFIVLISFLIRQFNRIRLIKDKDTRIILYSAFLVMPFNMIIDSGYLLYPQLFAYMASLFVFINHCKLTNFGFNYEKVFNKN